MDTAPMNQPTSKPTPVEIPPLEEINPEGLLSTPIAAQAASAPAPPTPPLEEINPEGLLALPSEPQAQHMETPMASSPPPALAAEAAMAVEAPVDSMIAAEAMPVTVLVESEPAEAVVAPETETAIMPGAEAVSAPLAEASEPSPAETSDPAPAETTTPVTPVDDGHLRLEERVLVLPGLRAKSLRSGIWREPWEHIKAISAEFKTTRYPSREEKDAAWQRFQAEVDQIKTAQHEQREAWEAQAKAMLAAIEGLAAAVEEAKQGQRLWRQVWTQIGEVSAQFKETRFPVRQERDAAWERYQALVRETKVAQEDDRRAFDEKRQRSTQLTDQIIQITSSIRPHASPRAILDEVMSMGLAGAAEAILPTELLNEIRDKLKHYSDQVKNAWEQYHTYQEELLGKDKKRVIEALRSLQNEVDEGWKHWKDASHRAYEERQRVRGEREARRKQWESRVSDQIGRLDGRLDYLTDRLARAEEHLKELYMKRLASRNPDFSTKVDAWIAEERSRIDELEKELGELQGRRDEVRSKLER